MSEPSARSMIQTPYQQWLESEGLAVTLAAHIPDLRALPLEPWDRIGATVRVINHEASDRTNDCRVYEIAPGTSLTTQRHLYEQLYYVLVGQGATTVWSGSSAPQTFEWQAGSLFAIPLNSSYQMFNTSGAEASRLLSITNAPTVLNMFANEDFVFNCPYDFSDRFDGTPDYFAGAGSLSGRYWEGNFVPDVRRFELVDHHDRGAGGKTVGFELAKNRMKAHASEFPTGTYKKAHRHGPGAHVIILEGSGYSLMWREGETPRRHDWTEGSMIIPPDGIFHQHFNTGQRPARYLALRFETRDRDPRSGLTMAQISIRDGGGQIEYEDEDVEIRRMYRRECIENGVEYRMAGYFPED